MIAYKHAPHWSFKQIARRERMKAEIGCIYCWLEEGLRRNCEEVHHILLGNKRMGHWYTLPLCKPHHANCHDGTYSHDQQIDTWTKVQHALKLDDALPASKIVPRKVA